MTGHEAWRVEVGDCLDVLDRLPADSVDAVVCDPPYGLSRAPDTAEVLRHWLAGDDYAHRGGGFMGQSWDSFVPGPATWRACLRVLKPGGHLLAFGGTRTADLLAIAIRLAGFEIRDEVLGIGPRLDWLYASGWPKSRAIRCRCDRGDDADDAPPEHDVCGVRGAHVSAAEGAAGGPGSVLLAGVQEPGAPAERSVPGEGAAGRSERSVEGRGTQGPDEGQLPAPGGRPSAGVGQANGAGGRVHRAAPPDDGSADRAAAHVGGVRPPPGPRREERRAGELGAVAGQPVAQDGGGGPRCARCGLPTAQTELGTALKPAHEPIVVARKPFRVTVEEQVLATGTGALNIDACRIDAGGEEITAGLSNPANRRGVVGREMQAPSDAERNQAAQRASIERANALGRWPANVVLLHDPACERVGTRRVPTGTTVRRNLDPAEHETSIFAKRKHPGGVDVTYGDGDGLETIEAWSCAPGCPVALLDEQAGELRSGDPTAVGDAEGRAPQNAYVGESRTAGTPIVGYGDQGGASRFLYQAKASPAERDFGLGELPLAHRQVGRPNGTAYEHMLRAEMRNVHPTVKPIDLMRWLVRLAVPRGGLVLDPFTGSGTTGCAAVLEGVRFLGVERDEDYAAIARRRVRAWAAYPPGTPTGRVLGEDAARRRAAEEVQERRRELADAGQLDLLAGAEG